MTAWIVYQLLVILHCLAFCKSSRFLRDVKDSQCSNIADTLNHDNDEKLSDVTFIVGPSQKELKANRFLLASISDVFKAMLFGRMEEGKPNAEVSIDDIDANAFQSVFRYAYCTNPKIDIENVVSVKHICRKYQIHSLSKICDSYFDSSLSSESMCSLLNDSLNYKLVGVDACGVLRFNRFFRTRI